VVWVRVRSQPDSTVCRTWASKRIRNRHTVVPTAIAVAKPKRCRAEPSRSAAQSAIAANVRAGVAKLTNLEPTIKSYVETKRLKVVGAVYDLASGEVKVIG